MMRGGTFLSTPSARRATDGIHALMNKIDKFLSTPSARRATVQSFNFYIPMVNFYPRPPRGGRPIPRYFDKKYEEISIHALREEGDVAKAYSGLFEQQFLSTPSARRATRKLRGAQAEDVDFYPRPPRGGRRVPTGGGSARRNFYPRPPRGGRRRFVLSPYSPAIFLSTPSARRATAVAQPDAAEGVISIHALREEGDGLPPSKR